MKEAIRARALELGFDDCRFTTAAPPASAGRFTQWIESGQHGAMDYLARNAHKRINPQEILAGAKSLVCVALNYHTAGRQNAECKVQNAGMIFPSSAKASEDRPSSNRQSAIGSPPPVVPTGVVARYARHKDYHEVMGARLRELCSFLDAQEGNDARSLWYVDTGPILEREYAQRAGLGFTGKHTNLISRRFGNWILLGEILTPLQLEPDAPEKNRCGTCTCCITACPTNAITAPFQLDARLCIAYLTIELKGSIPPELRPAIGNRIFGCDDCLEVCPWNRFASDSRTMKHSRRDDLQAAELIELLSLDNAAFKKRFRGTPIERSKRRGLLRNVCVALGNTAGREALPALEKASQDSEALIAEHAQWAMDQIS